VSYAYPYGQVIYLGWVPGNSASPVGGLVLVTVSALLSVSSLLSLNRLFGVRPALRGLMTTGPYRFVRHPMYLSYVLADIGYNLEEWSTGTLIMVTLGWMSLAYRMHAEERVLSKDSRWPAYVQAVRYRLVPGIW
jgi:protein-S-isoprenylcysteine O-methyltransferase Ste14